MYIINLIWTMLSIPILVVLISILLVIGLSNITVLKLIDKRTKETRNVSAFEYICNWFDRKNYL